MDLAATAAVESYENESSPSGSSHPETLSEAFDRGRREGIEEGRRIEQHRQSIRLDQIERRRTEQVASMCDRIALERKKLMQELEPEIVELALRIAERIVRHEVVVDPLVLTNSIRAALGQLADHATVRLRVPKVDGDLWQQTFEHLPSLKVKPEIILDEELCAGECELETNCGSVDLSITSQLREIERILIRQDAESPLEGRGPSETQTGDANA
nr:FliH/SctL family protein [Occallatibacter savannae]